MHRRFWTHVVGAFALCSVALSMGSATAAQLMPAYFQASFDAAAAAPLHVLPSSSLKGTVFEGDLVGEALAAAVWPALITQGRTALGASLPSGRHVLMPSAAAYASLGPESGTPLAGFASDVAEPPAKLLIRVPLPIRRPAGIDALRADAPPVSDGAPTKVAMLGALPGAGIAIGQLAQYSALPAIVKGVCSVSDPFKLTALGPGGRTILEPAATVDAAMIQGLERWEAGMQAAAMRDLGQPVKAIHIAASYGCRTMNHIAHAHMSEHAHANAIDIAGYETTGGDWVTVKHDFYGSGSKRTFLRDVHGVTCNIFQVVLGPGSDGMHEDHFHMDLGHWKACR